MLGKLTRSLFWRKRYEEFWRRQAFRFGGVNVSFYGPLSINLELLKWDRRLDEKKAFWGERGKERGYTPEQAVFHALQETANEFYMAYSKDSGMEDTWLFLAEKLQWIASIYARDSDTYGTYENKLSAHWKTYYQQVEEERQKSKRRSAEVRSYRFPWKDVESAWDELIQGKAPDDAKRIWKAMLRSIKTAHEIADEAAVSVERFVFWMIVLRDNGLVEEYPHDEPKYVKSSDARSDGEKLSSDHRAVLRALEEDVRTD
jgi:hypothetical protein